MKRYLVAYTSSNNDVKSVLLYVPNKYSLVRDANNDFSDLRKRVVKYCKPCLSRTFASPNGGGLSTVEYSNSPLGVESIRILSVSAITDS